MSSMNNSQILAIVAIIIAGIALASPYVMNTNNTNDLEQSIADLETEIEHIDSVADSNADELATTVAELEETHHQIEELEEKLSVVASQATVIGVIDSFSFHGLENSLEGGEIPSRTDRTIQRVIDLMESTSWPHELEGLAENVTIGYQPLLDALTNEDIAGAIAAIEAAHHAQHNLSGAFWALIGDVEAHGH